MMTTLPPVIQGEFQRGRAPVFNPVTKCWVRDVVVWVNVRFYDSWGVLARHIADFGSLTEAYGHMVEASVRAGMALSTLSRRRVSQHMRTAEKTKENIITAAADLVREEIAANHAVAIGEQNCRFRFANTAERMDLAELFARKPPAAHLFLLEPNDLCAVAPRTLGCVE